MKNILWQPNELHGDKVHIRQFIQYIKAQSLKGTENINTFWQLHAWSIQQAALFWQAVWDFAGLIGDKGGITIRYDKTIKDTVFFPQAKLNYAENLLAKLRDDQVAIIAYHERGRACQLSTQELKIEVKYWQSKLKTWGVRKGDRVAAMCSNTAESIIAMLATTSLGAVWTSCSPEFGTSAVLERFRQISPKVLFLHQSYEYNGKQFSTGQKTQAILRELESCVCAVLITNTTADKSVIATIKSTFRDKTIVTWFPNQSYDDKPESLHVSPLVFEPLNFNDPLFIMYSSGTTGQPKCIVHGVGGTLIEHAKEHLLHCNIQPNDRVFYYSTCSWMMWNWHVSALFCGATLVVYDGAAVITHEQYYRPYVLLDLIEQAGVNFFGVSAKYLEVLQSTSQSYPITHQLNTLKVIASTGSPLMPEYFDFVYQQIKAEVHLMSISGGTDILGCFVLGCPILPVYRGEIQAKSLGLDVQSVDENGQEIVNQLGELVCRNAFPSMPIYFWNDVDGCQYQKAYYDKFANTWHHGDFIILRAHQGIVIYGRSDTTLNPGGVRIGTAEVYRIVQQFPQILEAVAVGKKVDGDEKILLFIILQHCTQDVVLLSDIDAVLDKQIKQRLRDHCSSKHVPYRIYTVADIPRTHSGKISEMAVKNCIEGRVVNNSNALSNPQSLIYFSHIFNDKL